MRVYIEKEGKTLEVKFSGKAKDLLNQININPESVVITKNNELITTEDEITDEDEIKLLSVISGG